MIKLEQHGTICDLLSLPDLVQAKKTQRDKDWPMIRRLVEAHYFQHRKKPSTEQVGFWLLELRTPELLVETARLHPVICRKLLARRTLLQHALASGIPELEDGLKAEEAAERELDRAYWLPLRKELEKLRHAR